MISEPPQADIAKPSEAPKQAVQADPPKQEQPPKVEEKKASDPPAKSRPTWEHIRKEIEDFNQILARVEAKLPSAIPGFKEVYESMPDVNMENLSFEKRVGGMQQYYIQNFEKREKLIKSIK